jgi:hypothetical protein
MALCHEQFMHAPIKLNRSFWPKLLCRFLPSAADPRSICRSNISFTEFTQAVSGFKFGTTFKTSQKARFPLTIASLAGLKFSSPPVILDVGASDGTTSLDVMQALAFSDYFVTDLNTEVLWRSETSRSGDSENLTSGDVGIQSKTFFYDPAGQPILLVTNKWVIYRDTVGAIAPFGALVRMLFAKAPAAGDHAGRILLINPALHTTVGGKILVRQYDIFRVWPFEKVDIIIAANILNKSYFSDAQLGQALQNLRAALNENGYLVIVDSRKTEKATIFQRSGRVVTQIHGGTEIEELAARHLSQ